MSGASRESSGPPGQSVLDKVCLNAVDTELSVPNKKVDQLSHFQENITEKLQGVSHGVGHLEQGLHRLEASQGLGLAGGAQAATPEVLELVRAVRQDAAQHGTRLRALFRMVVAVDKAIAFWGALFQNSKVVDFVTQRRVPWRRGSLIDGPEESKEKAEEKGAQAKLTLSPRGMQAELRDAREETQKVVLLERTVDSCLPTHASEGMGTDHLTRAGVSPGQRDRVPGQDQVSPDHTLLPSEAEATAPGTVMKDPRTGLELPAAPSRAREDLCRQEAVSSMEWGVFTTRPESQASQEGLRLTLGTSPQPLAPLGSPAEARVAYGRGEGLPRISILVQETDTPGELLVTQGGGVRPTPSAEPPSAARPGGQAPSGPGHCHQAPGTESGEEMLLAAGSWEAGAKTDKSGPAAESVMGPSGARRDKGGDAPGDKGPGAGHPKPGKNCAAGSMGTAGAGRTPPETEAGSLVLDDGPAPPAPFKHRVVSVKEASVSAGYTICQHEVLGGGRFGQVHRCTETSTGLPLAAKVIKVKSTQDREDVRNEISIMNQLSHVNLIQLYDAFESRSSFTLVMEYVGGGELFDRITDEKYHLTELDVVLFTRQICEGVQHLHQQYVLHLDLKPENILCVNQTGHQIKIIDFGLARRYKPREKLRVNFGTPEFLAPEVVNYEFVSFPTDMWSVGVITYMLLSGLSPFLGETDAETMNFIVNCSWDFDADSFEGLSEEAKDFVSQLLVKEKSCRMSAAQCLKHEWLHSAASKASESRVRLRSQLLLQKYLAQRKWKKHFHVVTAANRLRKFPASP